MYDLLLPKFIHTLDLGPHDGWHAGLPLARLPAAPIQARCETSSPLMLVRALTPLFHRELIDVLREHGADNLQTVPVALHTPAGVLHDWQAVNVVGRVPLASFVLELPPVSTIPEPRRAAAGEAMDAAAPHLRRVQQSPPLPRPDALVTRLAEGNHPLLVRSDVMAALDARFNQAQGGKVVHQVRFDDLRFADFCTGIDFATLLARSCEGLPAGAS
ncbi:hypothetical protein WCE41_13615 [Luteimonas sp. MJ246]|uniref:hypothetical protein n=1 Tax=Luteimonas sp. MJ174 TaxID=3129237 RepID=UPI0031BB2422